MGEGTKVEKTRGQNLSEVKRRKRGKRKTRGILQVLRSAVNTAKTMERFRGVRDEKILLYLVTGSW